jgi:hypothetical protein
MPPFANHFLVVQTEDGMYQVGLHDNAAGPFPTRSFAEAVAGDEDDPPDKRRRPAAGTAGRYSSSVLIAAASIRYANVSLLTSTGLR